MKKSKDLWEGFTSTSFSDTKLQILYVIAWVSKDVPLFE